MADANFEIPATKMVKPTEFDIMYFTKLGKHLPSLLTASRSGIKDTPWKIFVQELRNRAVMVDPSESTEMIEIGILIEELAINYKIAENPEEWTKATGLLLVVGDHYLIKLKKMKELAEDLNIKTDLGKLYDIISQNGMKKPGNPLKSVMGSKTRAWWFKKDLIESYRNARPGDDRNE